MPRIIGGRDLLPYESANAEKDRIFAEFNAVYWTSQFLFEVASYINWL